MSAVLQKLAIKHKLNEPPLGMCIRCFITITGLGENCVQGCLLEKVDALPEDTFL